MRDIWLFDASVPALIPLYSIGIFLSFAISQAGMVRHWYEERGGGWRWKLGLNLVGAVVTGLVFVDQRGVEDPQRGLDRPHHRPRSWSASCAGCAPSTAARRPSCSWPPTPRSPGHTATQRVVVTVNGINRAVVQAVNVGRTLSDDIRAVYVTADPDAGEALRERWIASCPTCRSSSSSTRIVP